MKRIFIYYSLSGNGDKVAEYLSKHNIDIRKVETKEPLPNNFTLRIMTGGFKSAINYKDKLINFDDDISDYDEVIIGSPIWNDRLSSPINTVLNKINLTDKKVVFINYSGSKKSNHATKKIKSICENATIIDLKEPLKYEKEMINDLEGII